MLNQKKALLIIFVTVFIDLVGFGIIIPLNPFLARHFGADPLQVGLLMTVYSLAQFLMAPFWGRLSDRHGRRPVIVLSLLGAALAHVLFGFAESLLVLFVARVLAGFFGANISTAAAYIADITPRAQRSRGMAIIGAAFGSGFVLGPFIGGVTSAMGESLGQHPPFGPSFSALVAASICFLNFLAAIYYLPETLAPEDRAARSRKSRWESLVSAFSTDPLKRFLSVAFLVAFAMAMMEASLFMFVQDLYSWPVRTASFGFAYVGLVMVFTQGFLVRKWIYHWGERKMLLVGIFLMLLGFSGISFGGSVFAMALAVTLLSLGNGLVNPSLHGSVSLHAQEHEQGHVLGVNQSMAALGRILGPAVGGYFYRDLAHGAPFLAAAGVMILAGFFLLSVRRELWGRPA